MTTDHPGTAWERYRETMAPPPPRLGTAARANDVAELDRLLAEGHAIDERDHRGYAPVMLAAYAGNLEALELLLARGANPNTTDLFGNTALMGAAFKGLLPIVERLLAAGAELAATNNAGLDARGFALSFGRADVFAVLDRHARRAAAPATGSPAQEARR